MNSLMLFALISSVTAQAEVVGGATGSSAQADRLSFPAVEDTSRAPIQLAAAIGIVKPESSTSLPPETPVESAPVPESVPPAAETGQESEEASADTAKSGGSNTKAILIGVGVAAVLGIAAGGGGGGGGGSSTPGH
jgi:hypothetical protein